MRELRLTLTSATVLWQAAAACWRRQRHLPTVGRLLCCLAAIEGVFRPGLLGTGGDLKAVYDSSAPYPHCVINDICDPDLLRKVGCGGLDLGAAWHAGRRDARAAYYALL